MRRSWSSRSSWSGSQYQSRWVARLSRLTFLSIHLFCLYLHIYLSNLISLSPISFHVKSIPFHLSISHILLWPSISLYPSLIFLSFSLAYFHYSSSSPLNSKSVLKPDNNVGEHRGAERQGQHPAPGLHLPAQAGGVRSDGRHGVCDPVRCQVKEGLGSHRSWKV